MEETNSIEFDKQLENEFSSLGFNYQDIKAIETRDMGQSKSKMFLDDYLDSPFMLADGLAVIFTITNDVNAHHPVIETMSATLYNDSCFAEFTPLVEKNYSLDEDRLPTKEQILSELKDLLRILNDKNLVNEFARIGFDLKDLLNSAERVSEHELFLSKTIDNDIRLDPGNKVKFTFSVTSSLAEQMYSIEHITAVMRRGIPGSRDQVLFENDYLSKEALLPTIEEIFDQIAKS